MLLAAKVGMNFVAVTPEGYEPDQGVVKIAAAAAKKTGASVEVINNPKDGMKNADAVYTDVWISMGQESEKEKKTEAFTGFQINAKLMSYGKSKTLFMHCLPAHRGEEVTDEVMDSKNSVVFDQAENRLHSAKAVLITLMHGE
jgi:ornithine carbamoyltransferase